MFNYFKIIRFFGKKIKGTKTIRIFFYFDCSERVFAQASKNMQLLIFSLVLCISVNYIFTYLTVNRNRIWVAIDYSVSDDLTSFKIDFLKQKLQP